MKNSFNLKTVKKISAILMILFVLSGLICVGVSAYTLTDVENLTTCYSNRINVFAHRFTATDDETKKAIDLKVLCENVCDSGYDLCYVFSGASTEEEGYAIVDGCMYKYAAGQEPYKLGWYLVNDTEAFTLEEGCRSGIVTLKGEEGKIIRRFLNAPLVAEFAEVSTNSQQIFYVLMNYLEENNAYTEESTVYFVGTVDEFEIAIYKNSVCGKVYEETIGDYIYSVDSCQSPSGLGVYALMDGEILSLSEAFRQGIDLDKVNELLVNTSVKVKEVAETPTTITQNVTGTESREETKAEDTKIAHIDTEPTELTFITVEVTEMTNTALIKIEPIKTTAPNDSTTETITDKEFDDDKLVGDVNGDGKINIKDATTIQKHLAKIDTLLDKNFELADFNADSIINIKDATAIQKYIAKI